MRPSTTALAVTVATLVASPLASAFTFTVGVGKDEVTGNVVGLGFDPSRIQIPQTPTDDQVVFQMLGGTHQVAQVSFDNPCTPLQGGFLQPEPVTAPNGTDAPGVQQFTFAVQDEQGVYYFSDIANGNCQRGAIFCINTDETSTESCSAFRSNALALAPAIDTLPSSVFPGPTGSSASSQATSSSSSSTGTMTSSGNSMSSQSQSMTASAATSNTATGSAPSQSAPPTSAGPHLNLGTSQVTVMTCLTVFVGIVGSINF
ncbi:hypothetical protein OIO90_003550 [Microbotryomycetes sp. JL221]|nr:hypothetical protein OIO90_003550 [Microbotryomycetes sp. JL221]